MPLIANAGIDPVESVMGNVYGFHKPENNSGYIMSINSQFFEYNIKTDVRTVRSYSIPHYGSTVKFYATYVAYDDGKPYNGETTSLEF